MQQCPPKINEGVKELPNCEIKDNLAGKSWQNRSATEEYRRRKIRTFKIKTTIKKKKINKNRMLCNSTHTIRMLCLAITIP